MKPEASGKQGDSVQPSMPVKPEASGKQGDSVQPSMPVKPVEEKPKEETPKASEKEEHPTQPEASGKQGDSAQPSTPVKPEASGEQGDSAQPSTSVKPEASGKQGDSAQPSTSVKPEASGKQGDSAQPSTPVKPEASGKQGDSAQPSTPVKPEASGKQGDSAQPSTPVKPEASGKQGDSAQPSTPVKPEASGKEGQEVQPENSRNEGTSTTPAEGKEETSHVSDNNPVLTRKTKTLFLEALDKKVSLELYDVSIDDIEFRAVEIEDEKAINAVKNKLQGNKNVRIYDLSLHKGGKEISLGNNRLVRVALAEYENKNIEVYHVEKNGNLKQIRSVINNGSVEFYINHFSQFVIVSDKNNLSKKDVSQSNKDLFSEIKTDAQNAISKGKLSKQETLPKTGINNNNDFSLLAIISLLVLVLSRKQKDSLK